MRGSKELIKLAIKEKTIPEILYKYRKFDNRTDEIILNSEFYFAPPSSFNDPFDCNLSYKKDYNTEEIDNYKEEYAKKILI